MPPPPLNPQGSRAGLITAVVVLSILFVTSAIFAFYYASENSRNSMALANQKKEMNRFASADALGDTAVIAAAELGQSDPKYSGMSAIQVLLAQNNEKAAQLAQLTAANAAMKKQVEDLTAESEDKSAQLKAAGEKYEAEVAQRKQVAGELGKKFDEQTGALTKALGDLAAMREQGTLTVTKSQDETKRALEQTQGQLSTAQKEIAERDATIAQKDQEIQVLLNKIGPLRNITAKESVIRQADGKILRVPGNDNVFINLGLGDQITPGMTFEVYDRFAGIPGLGENADAGSGTASEPTEVTLPMGKASIEVVRLSNRQAECRIIRQQIGQPVVEGDLIANLVYDKNTKYNFVVFGEFDLDQNGQPTPGDAEVVQRLITQWGGKVEPAVNVNTDFIVLGFEPEVPLRDDAETPTDVIRREAAEAAAKAYNDVRDRAIELNVPILNQNRFLYYVGYYDLAKR